MPIIFLKQWTIILTKIPMYGCFRGDFELSIDFKLMEMLFQSTDARLTDDRKKLLLPILNKIDKTTNVLTIKHSPRYGMGRFYSDQSLSPIVLSRYIKHTLFGYLNWIDLDMVKGHPSIMVNVARLANLDLKTVRRYIDDCDQITRELQQYYSPIGDDEPMITTDRIKNIFNRLIYGGGMAAWFVDVENEDGIVTSTNDIHPFIIEFIKECHQVMDLIYINNPEMVKKLKKTSDATEYKTKSRVMSYFWQTIENEIIHICCKILLDKGIMQPKKFALEYDGICLLNPGEGYDLDAILFEINTAILTKTGMNVTMKWKPYNNEHVLVDIIRDRTLIPVIATPINAVIEVIIGNDLTMLDVKTPDEFKQVIERTFFKIRHLYYEIIPPGILQVYTASQLKEAFRYKTYDVIVKGFVIKRSLIDTWLISNNILQYDGLKCYPPPLVCPKNEYNTWIPYYIETVPEIQLSEEISAGVEFILDHLRAMCGHDEIVYNHFIAWLGFRFAYPALKSFTPHIIGPMGCGKTEIFTILTRMMGSHKTLLTINPEVNVWGQFNELLKNATLIGLDELNVKQTHDATEFIKGLQTGKKITINEKGVNKYELESYLAFIAFSNKPTLETTKGDRRNMMWQASGEHVGNSLYFEQLRECYGNDQILKHLHKRLINNPFIIKFDQQPIPLTSYQKILQDGYKTETEQFLESYIQENHPNSDEQYVTIKSTDLYLLFNEWKSKFGTEYKITHTKFTTNMLLMTFNNGETLIEKKHTRTGNVFIFQLQSLQMYFGIVPEMPSVIVPSLLLLNSIQSYPPTPTPPTPPTPPTIPLLVPTFPPEGGGGETMESFERVTCPSRLSRPRKEGETDDEMEEEFYPPKKQPKYINKNNMTKYALDYKPKKLN